MPKKTQLQGNKIKLINIIQALLQQHTVETQEEIRLALEEQGLVVNQTMISRILYQIGAIKMKEGKRIVYRLPVELTPVAPHHSLTQLILNISSNETLIVIKTSAGSAQLVARLIDCQKMPEILGSVAGDDTIFIVPRSIKLIPKILKELSHQLMS